MYYEFFSKSPLLILPLFSLTIFIAVFAAILVRVSGRSGRELEAMGRLALGFHETDDKERDRS